MNIFSVFTLLGGLAFFLYGMDLMSKSLEKMAGGKLEGLLKKMTSNPIKSLLLGIGITVAIQSSSAVTVMLVGLVNSGVMTLSQSIGVIMGSNIGTTITAWILSLAGLESDNVFVQLLKPKNFSPLLAFIGILLVMASKKQRRRDVGRVLIGFSVLMTGMEFMSGAVEPIAEMPAFTSLFTAFSNPILGVLFGAVFTAVIQSSSASVGILQALALTGAISFGSAIPIIMGQNIGTTITAVISSIGVNRNAKQVSAVHASFNLIGTSVCLVLFYGANAIVGFEFLNTPITAAGIAVCHSAFNIFTTVILLPFTKQLELLAQKIVKEDKKDKEIAFLDPLLLRTPAVAIAECANLTREMGELARTTLGLALQQYEKYTEERETLVAENENKLDIYEDRLGRYLIQISQKGASADDIRTVSRMLHAINDFERIGDHCMNLQDNARELYEKNLQFTDKAQAELKVVRAAIDKIVDRAFTAFATDDVDKARRVEALEETIDGLIEEVRARHIQRLQTGECTIQMGFILNDHLANLERVSDHCSNIAISVIQEKTRGFNPHAYAQDVKLEAGFQDESAKARAAYRLPE